MKPMKVRQCQLISNHVWHPCLIGSLDVPLKLVTILVID